MATRRRSAATKVIDTPRQALPLPIGAGLYPVGDLAKAPPGTAAKIKNCFVRPGPRIEKRDGWLRDSSFDATMYPGAFAAYNADTQTTSVLVVGGGQLGKSGYRQFDGTYTVLSTVFTVADYTNFLNKLYSTYSTTDSTIGSVDSFDGSTAVANAINATMSGATIASFNHRMFLGYIREKQTNEVRGSAAYKFEDNTVWTLGGGPPTVSNTAGLRKLTIIGSTDTLKTTAAAYTPGAADEYIQVYVDFRAYNTTTDMPFTITVEDAAGANIYGTLEVLALNRTIQPDWQRFVFPSAIRIPASTAVYVKYKPGTTTVAAVAGSVDVADENNNRGLQLTKGRRTYSTSAVKTAINLFGSAYPYRFVWCEVDDPTYWRASSYYDCKEVAGEITVIREGNSKLHVFKSNAIWSFNPQDNASLPIVFSGLIRNIGCIGPKAIKFFENTLYFMGINEVYAWTGEGEPVPLAGDAMRETLFPSGGIGGTCLAIDEERREMWIVTEYSNIWIYNLTTKIWSGPLTVTQSDGTSAVVHDLIYIRASGESTREMWCAVEDIDHATGDVLKLRSGQTKDNIIGTERDVVAEYWFRPIQTLEPKQALILESLEIDHKVTGSQSASTTTAEISYDGGTTFANAVNVTLAPLASGDYQPMRLDLWESSDRMLVAIKHTGLAGPTYFNMSGASAMVQICGDRIQTTNPTTTSSTL